MQILAVVQPRSSVCYYWIEQAFNFSKCKKYDLAKIGAKYPASKVPVVLYSGVQIAGPSFNCIRQLIEFLVGAGAGVDEGRQLGNSFDRLPPDPLKINHYQVAVFWA